MSVPSVTEVNVDLAMAEVSELARQSTEWAARIDHGDRRSSEWCDAMRQTLKTTALSFADDQRGTSYRRAQEDRLARRQGIHTLLQLATGHVDVGRSARLLDVLGGNGLVAEVARLLGARVDVLTSDVNSGMVHDARTRGLPALLGSANATLLADESVDAVLIAYGTHHIPRDMFAGALREARRVLTPGGRIVLHDFEERGPAAMWFREVVDRTSTTGHDCAHFTKDDFRVLLTAAGFSNVEVFDMYDGIAVQGSSPDLAQRRLGQYLQDMYGLQIEKLGSVENLLDLAQRILRYPPSVTPVSRLSCYEMSGSWIAEVPRVALIGLGARKD